MTPSLRRARALALLAGCATLLAAACTGRNDGRRDGAGLSSNGAGPQPPAGYAPGQSTDTTTAPAGTPAGGAAPAAGAPAAGAPAAAGAAAATGTKAP